MYLSESEISTITERLIELLKNKDPAIQMQESEILIFKEFLKKIDNDDILSFILDKKSPKIYKEYSKDSFLLFLYRLSKDIIPEPVSYFIGKTYVNLACENGIWFLRLDEKYLQKPIQLNINESPDAETLVEKLNYIERAHTCFDVEINYMNSLNYLKSIKTDWTSLYKQCTQKLDFENIDIKTARKDAIDSRKIILNLLNEINLGDILLYGWKENELIQNHQVEIQLSLASNRKEDAVNNDFDIEILSIELTQQEYEFCETVNYILKQNKEHHNCKTFISKFVKMATDKDILRIPLKLLQFMVDAILKPTALASNQIILQIEQIKKLQLSQQDTLKQIDQISENFSTYITTQLHNDIILCLFEKIQSEKYKEWLKNIISNRTSKTDFLHYILLGLRYCLNIGNLSNESQIENLSNESQIENLSDNSHNVIKSQQEMLDYLLFLDSIIMTETFRDTSYISEEIKLFSDDIKCKPLCIKPKLLLQGVEIMRTQAAKDYKKVKFLQKFSKDDLGLFVEKVLQQQELIKDGKTKKSINSRKQNVPISNKTAQELANENNRNEAIAIICNYTFTLNSEAISLLQNALNELKNPTNTKQEEANALISSHILMAINYENIRYLELQIVAVNLKFTANALELVEAIKELSRTSSCIKNPIILMSAPVEEQLTEMPEIEKQLAQHKKKCESLIKQIKVKLYLPVLFLCLGICAVVVDTIISIQSNLYLSLAVIGSTLIILSAVWITSVNKKLKKAKSSFKAETSNLELLFFERYDFLRQIKNYSLELNEIKSQNAHYDSCHIKSTEQNHTIQYQRIDSNRQQTTDINDTQKENRVILDFK